MGYVYIVKQKDTIIGGSSRKADLWAWKNHNTVSPITIIRFEEGVTDSVGCTFTLDEMMANPLKQFKVA